MFNRERTKEAFGYDIDPNKKSRRSDEEYAATKGVLKKHLMVIDNCPLCNIEREIQFRNSLKNKPCPKCFHNSPEMHKIKLAQKGKILSEEHKQKLKENHWSNQGTPSPFKGKKHSKEVKAVLREKREMQFAGYTEEQKKDFLVKISCGKRGIPLEEFSGFSSPENTRLRQSLEGKAWTYDVLVKANFTCQKCYRRGGKLHAHHKNAFNLFPEQRFEIDNGACLCETCHNKYHALYGKGNNTEDQFLKWLKPINLNKPTVYLLVGAPSAGKSWVAKQLLDKYDYVSFDETPKKDHIDRLQMQSDKPKLYDPTFKISTIIRRHSDMFSFKLVSIYETEDVLRERMAARGGQWTDTIMKRNEVAKKRYMKYGAGGFIGTSSEVLQFLIDQVELN